MSDHSTDIGTGARRGGCSCGHHANEAAHAAALTGTEADLSQVVETAVLRALFPDAASRRALIKAVGASTVTAAVASLFPIGTATDLLAQGAKPEKTALKVGFIPITCATPIIMADPMGFYKKQGLDVEVIKTAGWAVIRDKTINKEYDAAHMLSPMPLAITLGIGSNPIPYTMPAVENQRSPARRRRHRR